MQPKKLILKLQAGDERAFEQIYHLYSRSVHGIIFNIVRDEAVCDEVLQDVFLKIWDNAASYDEDKGRFFTWILNIARNTSIDRIRSKDFKNKNRNTSSESFLHLAEESVYAEKIDFIGLQKYINKLGPTCKKLVDLLFFRGFTQKETAQQMSMPLGTVKTKNRACIEKLRSSLTGS